MNVLAGIAAGEGSATQRLNEVLRTFAKRAVRGRRLAYALLAEPVDVGLVEERARFRRTHGEIFSGILEDGMAAGEFPPLDARTVAACIAGAIPTALIGPLAPESHELEGNGDHVVDEIVRFCLAGVLGVNEQKTNSERRISA
jgi:hypothetical protein